MSDVDKPVKLQGKWYHSIQIASRELGMSQHTLRRAIREGRADVVGLGTSTPVVIRGKRYESMKAAAKDLGVTPQAISRAAARGVLEYVGLGKGSRGGRPKKPYPVNGIPFRSADEAAEALGYQTSALRKAVEQGGELAKGKVELRCRAFKKTGAYRKLLKETKQ